MNAASRKTLQALAIAVLVAVSAAPVLAAPPVPGAIFTTDSTCTGVNVNIYDAKSAVYLDGGPAHPGSAGLPDGFYYVQVTEPNGTLLGTSVGSANPTPVHVTNGEFDQCYQLTAILIKASDATPGYDTTTNPGGEYKAWVSNDPTFVNNSTKTDNFKVREDTPPQPGQLCAYKFYDTNANGVDDDGQPITGWQVTIKTAHPPEADHLGMCIVRETPACLTVDAGDYIVTEGTPLETNWVHTTPNPVSATVAEAATVNVYFGNVCLGAGGGHTIGFWSNKNGQALIGADDLALLVALNLRDGAGAAFDPATGAAYRAWVLNATAVNMAYMLSAQLSAMELNVNNGFVSGASLIYAPGTSSANALGFATVAAVMAEADAELAAHGYTPDGAPFRGYQEALKNALDNANNNLNFVQATACPFSFAQ